MSFLTESYTVRLWELAGIISEARASELYDKFYSDISRDVFDSILSADTVSSNLDGDKIGFYAKWLLGLYKNKSMLLSDLDKATQYINVYDKLKKSNLAKEPDINKYKSLPELFIDIKDYIQTDVISKKDKIKKTKKEGAEKVYEDSMWVVIVPKTEEAACYYGKNTQWCTAATKTKNYFNDYKSKGLTLFININKKNNEKYQFCFETNEFKDWTDNDISLKGVGLTSGLIDYYTKTNIVDIKNKTALATININILNNSQFIENLDSDGIKYLLKYSKEPERVINLLLSNSQFIENLYSDGIEYLLGYSKEPERMINLLLSNSQFIANLDSRGIGYLLRYSKEPEKVMSILGNKGQHLITNLNSDNIYYLLKYSKEPERVMNLLLNNQQFIAKLDSDGIKYLLEYSKEPERVMNLLLNNQQFIAKLDSRGIKVLLTHSKEPERVMSILGNKGQQLIANLASRDIEYLSKYSNEPEKIKSMFKKANILQEQLRGVVREIVGQAVLSAKKR